MILIRLARNNTGEKKMRKDKRKKPCKLYITHRMLLYARDI